MIHEEKTSDGGGLEYVLSGKWKMQKKED